MKKKLVGWEEAILKVLEKHNGKATLKEIYNDVPKLIQETKAKNIEHNIRGYLRRLKTVKSSIKQIGLSTYAFTDYQAENNLFEQITNKSISKETDAGTDWKAKLEKAKVHSFIQGCLIELGNFNGYQTYTPDKNAVFNGVKLSELIDFPSLPKFTYNDIMKIVDRIDVIWLKDRFPIRTFDVENSTDFSKALLRAYQLRFFKAKFILVADISKKDIFENRVNMEPFVKIKKNVYFQSYDDVYQLYKSAALNNKLNKKSKIFYGNYG
ncbi:MAG: hypothetical protein GX121_01185 [Ignavibacteria bacterium]|nr:hypothetical protein [Ignavibacteria bacterium]